MKHIIAIFGMAGLMFAATSCRKYLDVEPKGKVILSTVNDFDLFLNSSSLTASGARELNLLSDEADVPAIPLVPTRPEDLVYLWAEQYNTDTKDVPVIWGKHYGNIYKYNAVLLGINAARNGTDADKKRIRSEALLGRAFEYLYLVNLYAKPYNSTTADKDLAVPFMVSVDVSEKTPTRSTVEEIYNHIFADINEAIPGLSASNAANRFRGSVPAAYSILARASLYCGRYDDAAKYAKMAMGDNPPALIDYNTVTKSSQLPKMVDRPTELYARYSTYPSSWEYPTLNFLKRFDTSDLRLRLFYTSLGDLSFQKRGVSYFAVNGTPVPNFGTSVEEMKLIIAEVAARKGDMDAALGQLNDIRKNRIRKSAWKPLTSADKNEVLDWVMRERGFELAFRGFRWIDMRRLDAEGKMPAVVRYGANNEVRATLPPKSARYTLQIPMSVLYFNPDMPRNE
ncbi:RagB/SusD family nutrient uptake outer membrane protein [Chitinophaga sp. 212800010-3]|uniref:RagB/SusD family nutrient uptake outer membrane protein n=1 Tax=unclassified Chitinophaga TaxID=2619133 RepID=UPI002DF72446|nr:RagB/SusD family nutrient uptake outer membrane protein [Chitinophaga sp. 212800010-3]